MSAEYLTPGDQYIRKNGEGGFYRDQIHYWTDGLHWEDCDYPIDESEWGVIHSDYEEYMRYVAATGDDYLQECIVKRTRKQIKTWYANLGDSLLNSRYGMVIRYVRPRHGKRMGVMSSPEDVREFLNAEYHGHVPTCAVIHSRRELEQSASEKDANFKLTPSGLIRFDLITEVGAPELEIRRECKRIARKHLAKK